MGALLLHSPSSHACSPCPRGSAQGSSMPTSSDREPFRDRVPRLQPKPTYCKVLTLQSNLKLGSCADREGSVCLLQHVCHPFATTVDHGHCEFTPWFSSCRWLLDLPPSAPTPTNVSRSPLHPPYLYLLRCTHSTALSFVYMSVSPVDCESLVGKNSYQHINI